MSERSTLDLGPKGHNVKVSAKCANCHQFAPLYGKLGFCKECDQKINKKT